MNKFISNTGELTALTGQLSHSGTYADLGQSSDSKKKHKPSPMLYIVVFSAWLAAVVWFQPRLLQLMDMADTTPKFICLGLFILFINFAWLYGIYNLSIVSFAVFYKFFLSKKTAVGKPLLEYPNVAILYTTCNDFVRESLESCIAQDYPNYKVYICDDSSKEEYIQLVDSFASEYPDRVEVVRRSNRHGFKAGNMNNALSTVCKEKYFAIADADEILPVDFLSKLVPEMEYDDSLGFVQANHRANPNSPSLLARDMGVGIDLHWKWYQPLRNDFGFVMFLGHGALLRRKTWQEIGGFPNIVSEDLGFAIEAREKGYHAKFVEDVICYEDFPDTVRAFRVRHMKWTRGTSEFLHQKFVWLLKAKNITWQEKLDILFPTLNLPLTILYFLFMINANLIIPVLLGKSSIMTMELGSHTFLIPILSLHSGFNVIYDFDFYLITMLTFFSPVLCFIIGLIHKPLTMIRFLSKSTALYAALSPLSTLGVLAYFITGKAIFLVTGEQTEKETNTSENMITGVKKSWSDFLAKSHPDTKIVQGFEIAVAIIFGIASIMMFQISFLGLCLSFALLPILHKIGWESKLAKILVYVPFAMIISGIIISGLSMAGMQTIFFGYGFHF
ncbi:MAG: glycosyltransferase [Saprospiraceae bacterium]|nr:glycosyltransferase [Saprospiraceae bacterium]